MSDKDIQEILESKTYIEQRNQRIASSEVISAFGTHLVSEIWRSLDKVVQGTRDIDGTRLHVRAKSGLITIDFLDLGKSVGIKGVYEASGEVTILVLDNTEFMVLESELDKGRASGNVNLCNK